MCENFKVPEAKIRELALNILNSIETGLFSIKIILKKKINLIKKKK